MVTITENKTFATSVSKIRPPDCSKLAKNAKNGDDVTIFDMTSLSIFFCVVLFFLSSLLTGSSFMSISSLALELWQFSSIRDWPDIRKSELPPSEFCPISGDWGELWILNLKRMSLIQCYSILRISRVSSFCQPGGGGSKYPPTHPD